MVNQPLTGSVCAADSSYTCSVGVIHDAKTVWDAQIAEIGEKTTGGITSTWLKVNWFYTGEELEKLPGCAKGKWQVIFM